MRVCNPAGEVTSVYLEIINLSTHPSPTPTDYNTVHIACTSSTHIHMHMVNTGLANHANTWYICIELVVLLWLLDVAISLIIQLFFSEYCLPT